MTQLVVVEGTASELYKDVPVLKNATLKVAESYQFLIKTEEERLKEIKKMNDQMQDQIVRDIPRIAFFSDRPDRQSFLDISNLFKDTFDDFNRNVENSYTQGDWYAGGYTIRLIPYFKDDTVSILQADILKAAGKAEKHTAHFSIDVAYLDDQGVPCGVSLSLLRDDSNLDIAEARRPFRYAITMIRNVADVLDKREVTYIAHPDLYMQTADKGEIGATVDQYSPFLNMLKVQLNSKTLFNALSPIFKADGLADKDRFDTLHACILPGATANHMINRLLSLQDDHAKRQFRDHLLALRKIAQGRFSKLFFEMTPDSLTTVDLCKRIDILSRMDKLLIALSVKDDYPRSEILTPFFDKIQKITRLDQQEALFNELDKICSTYEPEQQRIDLIVEKQSREASHKEQSREAPQTSFFTRNAFNLNILIVSVLFILAIGFVAAFLPFTALAALPIVMYVSYVLLGISFIAAVGEAIHSFKNMHDVESQLNHSQEELGSDKKMDDADSPQHEIDTKAKVVVSDITQALQKIDVKSGSSSLSSSRDSVKSSGDTETPRTPSGESENSSHDDGDDPEDSPRQKR